MSKKLAGIINSNNKFFNSPAFEEVMKEYTQQLQALGNVNLTKFYRDFVSKRIPGLSYASFYRSIRRLNNQKLLESQNNALTETNSKLSVIKSAQQTQIDIANETRAGVAKAIAIGQAALEEILNNPDLIPIEKRAELLFKAMRAQDSRVIAIAAAKRSKREEQTFQHAFREAAYIDDDEPSS